jgi:hypothetical protein
MQDYFQKEKNKKNQGSLTASRKQSSTHRIAFLPKRETRDSLGKRSGAVLSRRGIMITLGTFSPFGAVLSGVRNLEESFEFHGSCLTRSSES